MENPDPDKLKKAIVPLDGLHCSACTARVEKGLREMKGMAGVSVNLSTRTAFLLYDPSLIDAAAVTAKVESLGYKALSFSRSAGAAGSAALDALEREKNVFFYRFLLGLLLTGFMLLDHAAGFSAYTMMAAAGLAWWFAGRHFHAGFARALKTRAADMDTLVSLSTSVMFFYGVFLTLYPPVGGGGGYRPRWHEVGMLITFINLGRWLETRSRGKAGEAVSKLFRIAPKFARRLCPTGEETVPVTEIIPGDKILLRPGEQVPADGRVTNGASLVDESLLTGEAVPREKAEGSSLYAGTVNKTGWLEFRAEGVGEETALMRICRAVQESQAAKSSVQRLVDRISAWFVPLVFFAACFSAALWFYYSSPYQAVNVFAAVLAVACPCAMGLAVPIAVAVGFGRAASEGILMRNVDILERVRRVDVIIFDKTGTITNGRLRLAAVKPFMSGEKEFLGLLAAAEDKSEHPFA
ncbi:MAG: ATPase P, partial [Elusimicrobia bacterium CG08_land_8_20_14_0_20_59_10]